MWRPRKLHGAFMEGPKPSRIACGSVIGPPSSRSELSHAICRQHVPRKRELCAIHRELIPPVLFFCLAMAVFVPLGTPISSHRCEIARGSQPRPVPVTAPVQPQLNPSPARAQLQPLPSPLPSYSPSPAQPEPIPRQTHIAERLCICKACK